MSNIFKRSDPVMTSVSFPDQARPHTAGGHVGGVLELRLDRDDKSGALELETVTAKLRVMMTTTWVQGKNRQSQTVQLHGAQILLFDSVTYAADTRPSLTIPFGFVLPPAESNLPSSFEGGTRPVFGWSGDVLGHSVAKIWWRIKLTASKRGTFTLAERKTLPFMYLQPPRPASIPLQIFPPPGPSGVLPPYPPAPPSESDSLFKTLMVSRRQRTGSLFSSKSSKAIVRLSIPSSPVFPSLHPIPYYISILVLSAPLSEKFSPSPSSPPPELPIIPSPSSLRLELSRHVHTSARGLDQIIRQKAGDGNLVDFSRENRVWYCEPRLIEDPEEPGVFRWGAEVVCVGEFRLGKGPTKGCGLTILPQSTKGLLSSGFMVDLSLPMKGLGNDVEKRDLFSFAISSPDPSLTEGSPPGFELFPPGYLESTGKDDDFDDDKK